MLIWQRNYQILITVGHPRKNKIYKPMIQKNFFHTISGNFHTKFQDINENQPNLSCDMYGVSNSLKWLTATGALLWGMSALDLLFSASLSCTYISPSAKIFSPIKCCKKRWKRMLKFRILIFFFKKVSRVIYNS